jgi:predicted DNA-binding ribbon-helix-helix protein
MYNPPDETENSGAVLAHLANRIDTDRDHANLFSAIRLFVLDYYRRIAEQKLAMRQK